MPYISVQTSVNVDTATKKYLKTELGKSISLIPGEKEAGTMIAFSDSSSMYFSGEEAQCAYLNICIL